MTIRKPNHDGHKAYGLPYPLSPSSPIQQPVRINGAAKPGESTAPSQIESVIENRRVKMEEPNEEYGTELPPVLRIGGGNLAKPHERETNTLPSALRIQPSEITPRSSFDSQRSKSSRSPSPAFGDTGKDRLDKSRPASNNPFLQHMGASAPAPMDSVGEESSAEIWADSPKPHPWHSQIEEKPVLSSLEAVGDLNSRTIQALQPTERLPATPLETFPSARVPKEVSFDDPWNDPNILQTSHSQTHLENHALVSEAAEWYGISQNKKTNGDQHPQTPPASGNEKDLLLLPARNPADIAPALPRRRSEQVDEQPPPKPPRPQVDTAVAGREWSAPSQAEFDRQKRQRSETYQVRLVNWFDASSKINPRRSPIMVQNANGPCPLLALVNALVLSTPSGIDTALLDTLERREQVSLGLLLDAVIDELMSGRRGDAAQNLPDVSELYAFLVNLHTGMNVNPSFLPKEQEAIHLLDAPNPGESASLSNFGNAGGFENTREMKLYSTFAVPLIHGWLPSTTHPACAALKRSAKTYEDAQNLMFAEEELENKLSRQGLNQDEQYMLQDIASVKYFLSSSATQLTGYGLNQITESLRPGSIAILFRNDHFSTLYRNPRSGQLFTLVTDMGYARHDEVVWESLVDVSGEGCELFAGDFRPVGNNNPHPHPDTTTDQGNGWTTVRRSTHDGRGNRTSKFGASGPTNTTPDLSSLHLEDSEQNPRSPKVEQEDHDLALALQLQEEEEERERQEHAARRREDELTHAFLSSQPGSRGQGAKRGPEVRPSIPPKGDTSGRVGRAARGGLRSERRGGTSSTESRPNGQPEDGEEAPPPTYEQAASGPAYHPPPSHPAHPHMSSTGSSNPARPRGAPPRQSTAYAQNSARMADSPAGSSPVNSPFAGSPSTRGGRFRNGAGRNSLTGRGGPSGVEGAPGVYRRNGGKATDEADRDRDCSVM